MNRELPVVKVLMIVEDDEDVRTLVRVTLSADPRFEIGAETSSAEEAIELARTSPPGLIILDHSLDGNMTGLEAAPKLKEACPQAKILMFTAYEHLRVDARASDAVDDFLLKTHIDRLLPTAQRLAGLDVEG